MYQHNLNYRVYHAVERVRGAVDAGMMSISMRETEIWSRFQDNRRMNSTLLHMWALRSTETQRGRKPRYG